MEYKGYTARVVFDGDAGVLFGEVEGLRDVVTFEATTVEDLATAFRDSVEDYLEMCENRGKAAEKPYSGKFLVRVDPRLHRDIAMAAARAGKSFNAFTGDLLKNWIGRDQPAGGQPASTNALSAPSPQASRRQGANARSVQEPVQAFLTNPPTGALTESQQRSPAVITPNHQSRHTPGSITPSLESRTPSGSRTPTEGHQRKHAA